MSVGPANRGDRADADHAHATRNGQAREIGGDAERVIDVIRVGGISGRQRLDKKNTELPMVGGIDFDEIDPIDEKQRLPAGIDLLAHIGYTLLLVLTGRESVAVHWVSIYTGAANVSVRCSSSVRLRYTTFTISCESCACTSTCST